MWGTIVFFNFIFFQYFTTSTYVTNDVDYYEDLIIEEIDKANRYQLDTNANRYQAYNNDPIYYGTYDFVIIGAGSAGSVIANRLSENRSWKILLLEAGKPGNNFTDIPAMQNYLPNTEYNWGYTTIPQKGCCLASNGVCPYPSGKALGGSSTINALSYSRGNKIDFDSWGNAGNEGWHYDDVLPYFKKSENSTIFGNNKYHSNSGELTIEQRKPVIPLVTAFLKANVEIGTSIGDYNGADQLVASLSQVTTTKGRRMSTEKAFLNSIKKRKNLDILTESYVIQILITDLSKTASGVIFTRNNIKYMVNVVNEVVLSAGVFGSPKILMQSGVGPSDDLEDLGIPVIRNLEVGQHMNDRTYIQILLNSNVSDNNNNIASIIRQYLYIGEGPMASLEDALSFFNTPLNKSNVPDFAFAFLPLKQFQLNGAGIPAVDQNGNFVIGAQLLHSKSKGRVYLKSNNPYEYPLIDTKCLSDESDVKSFLNAIKIIFKLLKTEAFEKYNVQIVPVATCSKHDIKSDAYWLCVFRQNASNGFHAGGTCKMGPTTDQSAVVDNKLKVHGISRLRVADASIVPLTLSSAMNGPSIMIGERAADFIKKDYQSF